MEKQFVPYELAVKIKELGFDESCFARFRKGMFQLNTLGKPHKYNSDEIVKGDVSAPLWQQAFDWCLNLLSNKYYLRVIQDSDDFSIEHINHGVTHYIVYDKTRHACLEKLIELIEQN